jgi:hypothetical protein
MSDDQVLTDEQIAVITNAAREIGAAMAPIAQHFLNAYADLAKAAAEFGVELRRTTNWIGGLDWDLEKVGRKMVRRERYLRRYRRRGERMMRGK